MLHHSWIAIGNTGWLGIDGHVTTLANGDELDAFKLQDIFLSNGVL